MRILVTGAGGFLGGEIARRLSEAPADEVIAAGHRTAPAAFANALAFDLGDRTATGRALQMTGPDVVVHAAGRTAGGESALLTDNVAATTTLASTMFEACPKAGLIFLGSSAQYGEGRAGLAPWREDDVRRPETAYGVAKQTAESAVFAESDRSGLKVVSLRLFNVVSPAPKGGQAFAAFLGRAAAAMARPKPWRVQMGPLDTVRDFVAIDDLFSAIERVIEKDAWGGAINVCTGVGRPVRELVEAVAARVGGLAIDEDRSLGHAGAAWSVGDPTRCETRLGFRPSADLSGLIEAAADGLMRRADARSRP